MWRAHPLYLPQEMEVSPHVGGGQTPELDPGAIPACSGVWCDGGTFPGAQDVVELRQPRAPRVSLRDDLDLMCNSEHRNDIVNMTPL